MTRQPARTAIPASRQPAVLADRGSCARHPRDLWTSAGAAQREAAARICVTCPVLAPCFAYAISSLPASDPGIWAGTTAAQRTVREVRRTVPVPLWAAVVSVILLLAAVGSALVLLAARHPLP